jgi:hypothetical protein
MSSFPRQTAPLPSRNEVFGKVFKYVPIAVPSPLPSLQKGGKMNTNYEAVKQLLGDKGSELFFPNLEYQDDAVDRGLAVAAAKLIFWRKYPIFRRWRFVAIVCSAYFEICAFISYERGKFFTEFVPKVSRELEIFM